MRCFVKILLLATLLFAVSAESFAQSAQEKYIDAYAELAVQEMYRSGVPASITLAQGMLESGNGRSELALKANNHFGIKCHNGWLGGRVYHDDDAKGECFRKYAHVSQSYRDHSDFLRYRDRYKFLFDLEPTDYKGWAYGLKKAGYATDPSYPTKLIRLIEDYRLYQYDTKTASSGNSGRTEGKKKGTGEKAPEVLVQRPLSPTVIEQAMPVSEQIRKKYFQFELAREMYSKNGVPFIYSSEGETYQSIAKAYGLFLKEILRFNDLQQSKTLRPGTVVYLQPKKNCAAKGLDMHVMESGETLRDIAQRYGVKLDKIYKLNGWYKGFKPKEGDCIKLRK
jgi:hypothetical protein